VRWAKINHFIIKFYFSYKNKFQFIFLYFSISKKVKFHHFHKKLGIEKKMLLNYFSLYFCNFFRLVFLKTFINLNLLNYLIRISMVYPQALAIGTGLFFHHYPLLISKVN
jgi:hypothetical protein